MKHTITRKPDQEIVIGPDIVVRVVRAEKNHCIIEIDAPRDVTVFRREMIEAMPSLVPWFREEITV